MKKISSELLINFSTVLMFVKIFSNLINLYQNALPYFKIFSITL